MKSVLHVGCGPADPDKLPPPFRGWRETRLDIDPDVSPDVVASIADMGGVPSDSFDGVWSAHNLEHLYPHEVPLALSEFLRVLRPGGLALIVLPDLQRVAELIAQDKLEEPAFTAPCGPITPLDVVFGLGAALATGNAYMGHRTGFTCTSLGNALVKAGFNGVQVQRWPFDLCAWARKT